MVLVGVSVVVESVSVAGDCAFRVLVSEGPVSNAFVGGCARATGVLGTGKLMSSLPVVGERVLRLTAP